MKRLFLIITALGMTVSMSNAQNGANTCYNVINGVGVYHPCYEVINGLDGSKLTTGAAALHTPAPGFLLLYANVDNTWHQLTSAGVDTVVGSGGGGGAVWGGITGTLSAQGDLQTALNNKLGLHATADLALALAATPTICSGGSAPRGVLANGNVTGCQVIPAASTPGGPANSVQTNNGSGGFGGNADFLWANDFLTSGVPESSLIPYLQNYTTAIGALFTAKQPSLADNRAGIALEAQDVGIGMYSIVYSAYVNPPYYPTAIEGDAIGSDPAQTPIGVTGYATEVNGALTLTGISGIIDSSLGSVGAGYDFHASSPLGANFTNSYGLKVEDFTLPGGFAIFTGLGPVSFGDKTSAPAFAGKGTAAFAPQTGAGTGATAVCATSHICDSFSGEVTLTSGSVGTPATGSQLIVTFGTTRTNQPNCAVDVEGGTTFLGVTHSSSTTTLTISAGVALVFGTAYAVTYVCGGQ